MLTEAAIVWYLKNNMWKENNGKIWDKRSIFLTRCVGDPVRTKLQ
jgi:hypothetical protein